MRERKMWGKTSKEFDFTRQTARLTLFGADLGRRERRPLNTKHLNVVKSERASGRPIKFVSNCCLRLSFYGGLQNAHDVKIERCLLSNY